MKIGAIIFSRISSTRLPGKALIDINGKTLIERVIKRSKLIKSVNHICISTSRNSEDDIIEDIGRKNGLEVFRGSLNDVVLRAYDTAKYYQYDSFLRLCGDRPFFDGKIYDQLITSHIKNNNDLTTNIFPRSVPPGLTGEIIKTNALEKCIIKTNDPIDREHVTRFMYSNPSNFLIQNITCFNDKDKINLRLVIDDKLDLDRARWIAENITETNNDFQTNKIIELAKKWESKKKTN